MTALIFTVACAIAAPAELSSPSTTASFEVPLQAIQEDDVQSDSTATEQDQPDLSEPVEINDEPPAEDVEAPAEPEAEQDAGTPINDGPGFIQTAGSRAIDWLRDVTSLQAQFEQVAPDGNVSTGSLALERPGKIRFDYDDPSPILLVADGASVAIADFDLETIDRAPISATPLKFLLGDLETLSADGVVAESGYSRDRLYVTLMDPDGQIDGQLTLVFSDETPLGPARDMDLLGWYALDAMGGTTELRLSEIETGLEFDPRLFILDDEDVRASETRRRRR
jgi:outer membrane lipoprotein-sorting protein